MTIESLNEQEVSKFLELKRAFWEASTQQQVISDEIKIFDEFKDLSDEEKQARDKQYLKENPYIFVAKEGDELVGYVSGQIIERPDRKMSKEGHIGDLFVLEESRSKGAGKKLFEAIESAFKEADCTHLGLDVFVSNTNARQFYKNLGFLDDSILMRKELK